MSVHGRARNSFLNSAPLSLSHANDHCCWSSSPYSISPFLSFPSPYFPCRLDQSGPPPSPFYSAGPSPPMLMSYFLRGCPKRQTGEKEREEGKRSFPQKKFPPLLFSPRFVAAAEFLGELYAVDRFSLFFSSPQPGHFLLSYFVAAAGAAVVEKLHDCCSCCQKKPTTIFFLAEIASSSYKKAQNSIDNPWLVSCKYPSDVVSRYAYHRMLDAIHVHYSLRDLVHPSPSPGRIKKGQRRMGNEYPGGVRPTPFFARPLPPDEIEHGRWIIIRRPRPKPPPPPSLVASLPEMLLFCWRENRQHWKPESTASNVFDALWRNSRRPLPAVRASPIPPSVYIL